MDKKFEFNRSVTIACLKCAKIVNEHGFLSSIEFNNVLKNIGEKIQSHDSYHLTNDLDVWKDVYIQCKKIVFNMPWYKFFKKKEINRYLVILDTIINFEESVIRANNQIISSKEVMNVFLEEERYDLAAKLQASIESLKEVLNDERYY